jgi:hypothetical protein
MIKFTNICIVLHLKSHVKLRADVGEHFKMCADVSETNTCQALLDHVRRHSSRTKWGARAFWLQCWTQGRIFEDWCSRP